MPPKDNSAKKMEYKKVSFDVNEIAPDAPAGEWAVSIPRGKCKVQPTKEDKFPMLIVPVRLDSTDEEDDVFQKALGNELSVMIVFFDNTKPGAARMSKMRLRQLCEAADVDLDIIPKEIEDPENDLEPLIRALEGKKFKAWTTLQARKDTGEVVTELSFLNPRNPLGSSNDDDDEDDDDQDAEESRPAPRGGGKKKVASKSASKRK